MATRRQSGFTLIEMLIYVALLVAIAAAVVSVVFSLAGAYHTLHISRDLQRAAMDSMERLTREVRNARALDPAGSTLGSHPGRLTLLIPTGSGDDTVEFYINVSGQLAVKENAVEAGTLTSSEIEITNLVFQEAVGIGQRGVRVEMTLSRTRGNLMKNATFYGFAVFRANY